MCCMLWWVGLQGLQQSHLGLVFEVADSCSWGCHIMQYCMAGQHCSMLVLCQWGLELVM
jgi:hypothetical protein